VVAVAVNSLEVLFDLGQWDDVLAMASELRPQLDSEFTRDLLPHLEYCRAHVLCWQGKLAEAHQFLDPTLPQARKLALQDLLPSLAVAVTLAMATGSGPDALRLIEEYERSLAPTAPASWYWGWSYLTSIVRACAALGEPERAQRLVGAAEPKLWRHRLQTLTARAILAEATGDAAAEQLYAAAADGWQEYGHKLERGLALLGLGRCRQRAGHPGAAEPLLTARAVFGQLGAARPLAEADTRLSESLRRTS
jgi:hypothetical protein